MSERADPTDDPGLVLGDDGVVYEVASDGTRTPLNSGSITLPLDLGPGLFEVSAEGLASISPSALAFSPQGALTITLPAGTAAADGAAIRVVAENAGVVLDLDSYGQMQLAGDSVDPTNGGGSIRLLNHLREQVHLLLADHGDSTGGRAGFFHHSPSAQQTLARPSGDAGDLWDVLEAYGLVAAP